MPQQTPRGIAAIRQYALAPIGQSSQPSPQASIQVLRAYSEEVNRVYYLSLFSSFLVALAAFALARAVPSSTLLRIILGLGAFSATILLALGLGQST